MPRAWVWLQLVIGWLPVWALYTFLIVASHPGTRLSRAALNGMFAIATAAALGVVVWRLTRRLPWPHPFRWRFLGLHLLLGLAYAATFAAITTGLEEMHRPFVALAEPRGPAGQLHVFVVTANWFPRFMVMGVWFYAMVAGVAYATRATERAARAETLAARSQLAALRAQLHPHFLFNALHTVVQLIPRDPTRAGHAAEQVAGLLRATIEEDRDLVPLAEEWAFVERYLEIERLRFGDRLRVRAEIGAAARDQVIPAFALLTLVENAVRHGAAPRVEPTQILVTATVRSDTMTVEVRDDGAGADPAGLANGDGTGLARLRDRLAALFGTAARLDTSTSPGSGFVATLTVPRGDE